MFLSESVCVRSVDLKLKPSHAGLLSNRANCQATQYQQVKEVLLGKNEAICACGATDPAVSRWSRCVIALTITPGGIGLR